MFTHDKCFRRTSKEGGSCLWLEQNLPLSLQSKSVFTDRSNRVSSHLYRRSIRCWLLFHCQCFKCVQQGLIVKYTLLRNDAEELRNTSRKSLANQRSVKASTLAHCLSHHRFRLAFYLLLIGQPQRALMNARHALGFCNHLGAAVYIFVVAAILPGVRLFHPWLFLLGIC